MEEVLNEINKSSTVNLRNNNIEISINRQQSDLEKYKQLKKSAYEDWKLGIITQDEYMEYSESYMKKISNAEETLNYLYEEKSKYKEQVQSENSWIEIFKKNRNITKLTKDVVDELIDCIYVHEGGDLTISYRFDNEFENALNYIKENEELSQNIVKAI